jgi:hypothetical protein
MPTLDSGFADGYRRLNRPRPTFTLERHVRGLQAFRPMCWGKIWLEVMLVRGCNDDDENLHALLPLIERIEPDEIHLNQPMRPPAEPWVRPASRARMERARRLFGSAARVVPGQPAQRGGTLELELSRAIMNLITRHPMTLDELTDCLEYWPRPKVEKHLMRLWRPGVVQSVRRYRQCFWADGAARFGRGSEPISERLPPAGRPGCGTGRGRSGHCLHPGWPTCAAPEAPRGRVTSRPAESSASLP